MRSTSHSSSVFENGKLRPGTYKIQNLYTATYLDIHDHSNDVGRVGRGKFGICYRALQDMAVRMEHRVMCNIVCCRPEKDLGDGRGLWEIKSLGAGHTVRRIEPGKPEQFCTPMNGLSDGTALFVNTYPAAWRIEIINDKVHDGYDYVHFFWGPTKKLWDLVHGHKVNGANVQFYDENSGKYPWQRWKLIPQSSSRIPGLGSHPPYDQAEEVPEQPSTRTQHTEESERDDFGTIVTEVTVVTTRKRYRVADD